MCIQSRSNPASPSHFGESLDFFATIVLVVYVAIIAVLFLFVIIMSNIKIVKIYKNVLDFFNL
uniref:Uncharacterized protein n=2 Tax=Physcomitrium patens TaxID=3218 RepID=A0A7I4C247_PHYPA